MSPVIAGPTPVPPPSRARSPRRRPRISRLPRNLGAHTLVLAGVSLAALAACAKVGEDVFSQETAPFDEPIRAWMLQQQNGAVRRFFIVVTHVGSPQAVIPITAAAAYWLRGRYGLPIAGAVVLAPSISLALFVGLKLAFRRVRPAGARLLRQKTYAFPSGHAAASAALCGTLAYVLWREQLLPASAAAMLATLPSLLIGTSRVYLDVHWSTDVVGGWGLGALVAMMSALFYESERMDTRERGIPVRGQSARRPASGLATPLR